MSTYFEVRGQRTMYKATPRGEEIRVGVSSEPFLRFESLSVEDAQAFATSVYRRENIICTIDEVTR